MKVRTLFIAVLILIMLISNAEVSYSQQSSKPNPIEWIWCSGDPDTHVNVPAFKWLKQTLEERTGGRMALKLYFAGAIYSEREGLEAIQKGIGQIGAIYPGYYPTRFPISQAFMVPGGISNAYAGVRIMEELYKDYMKQEVEASNCSLAFAAFPDAYAFQTKKPIKTPGDLKGLKIRSGSGLHNDILKLLDAIPVSMSTIDAYAAIQKGVLDGALLSISAATRYKFYEVSPYLTIPNFIFFNVNWGLQTKAYRDLPDDLKKIVYQVLREQAVVYSGTYIENANKSLETWKNVYKLSDSENNAFLEKLKELRDVYIKSSGAKGEELLRAIKPLNEKYKNLTYDQALNLQKTAPVQGIVD
jgi:TRAP-type transport system periplasmic protein